MHLQSNCCVCWIIFLIHAFGAKAIAWPEPTPASLDLNFRQRSPWPTGQPVNPLERRQNSDNNHRTCGYFEGDPGTCHFQLYIEFCQKVTDWISQFNGTPGDYKECISGSHLQGSSKYKKITLPICMDFVAQSSILKLIWQYLFYVI